MFCKIILINGCFYCYCYYYMQDYLQTTINSEPTPHRKTRLWVDHPHGWGC